MNNNHYHAGMQTESDDHVDNWNESIKGDAVSLSSPGLTFTYL